MNCLKRITAVLLCALFVLTMTACGSEKAPESAAAPVAEPAAQAVEETAPKADEAPAAESADETAAKAAEAPAEEPAPQNDGETAQTVDPIAELEQKYESVTQESLTWEYDSATRTLAIAGSGPMKSYAREVPEWDTVSGEAETVIIGDEVTSVGSGAFFLFTALREVRLGAAVEYIGADAFSECTALWTVNFPAGLKYLGGSAFSNTVLHSGSGFVLPEGLLYVGPYAFRSAFKENTVTIPASLSEIGEGAFSNLFVSAINVAEGNPCYASVDGVLYDKEIATLICYPADKQDAVFEVPGTVTTVLRDAIETSNALERLVIPASVTLIEEGAVYWNYALSAIEVAADNPVYKTVDGVLFTKDGLLLLCYPIADGRTEYTVPEGTGRIGNYALSQARNLTALRTGEGLMEIGDLGLYLCDSLTSVSLPGSLLLIGEKAFTFCDRLAEIRYAGSAADWQQLYIGEGNNRLTDGSVALLCAG